jgi:hypothetical protein
VISIATDAAPGSPNEDFVIASPDIAIVVDGAGVPFGGCHHGVAWYAQQIGIRTLAALVRRVRQWASCGWKSGPWMFSRSQTASRGRRTR